MVAELQMLCKKEGFDIVSVSEMNSKKKKSKCAAASLSHLGQLHVCVLYAHLWRK